MISRIKVFKSKLFSTRKADNEDISSGLLSGLLLRMSSMELTIPTPKYAAHTRLTIARVK